MSEISEIEIKSMTKEQNYMRGYENGKSDVLDKIKRDIFDACSDKYHMPVYKLDCDEIFEIINKYKTEGSDKV